MKQMTVDAEYLGKRKQTRKGLFLIKMEQVVPWQGLIESHYPKGEGGRSAYPLMAMLRVHLLQNWFGYSDPAIEEALYETTILRQFAELRLDASLTKPRSSTFVVCWGGANGCWNSGREQWLAFLSQIAGRCHFKHSFLFS